MFGYKDVLDYYNYVSLDNYVQNYAVPTFAIGSKDDPLCGHQFVPMEKIESEGSLVVLGTTNFGGHACHVDGYFKPTTWYQVPCMEFFNFLEAKFKQESKQTAK